MNSIADEFVLEPGESLFLRRGTTCVGTLRITSAAGNPPPATVGAYGAGGLPRIVAADRDAEHLDAVHLRDVANLTVRDLDISNPGSGGSPGSGDAVRNGLRVTAESRNVRNLTLTGLMIHDVDGDLTKSGQGSAGIQVTATGPPPIRFQNLLIQGNTITSVSRSGISIMGSEDTDRPDADQPWPAASTGVVVDGNRIDLVAGDGIVPRGTDGALIQRNVVSRGNLGGRPLLHPDGEICNAGIWTFRANNTLIRANEVFGMKHNGCDGSGFDVDYNQDGTIIEGNYSHDNEGGFVLLCNDDHRNFAEVRYNLSVDDGTMISHGPCGLLQGIFPGSLDGVRMYNNTIVGSNPVASLQLSTVSEMFFPGDFRFENNLVYARQPLDPIACGDFCTHNAFFGTPPSGDHALTNDPLLVGPLDAGRGMESAAAFRLSADSPLRGAGTPVPDGATRDFFGTPVPPAPSIGFHQFADSVPPPAFNRRACQRARVARNTVRQRVRAEGRRLRQLRRRGAAPVRVRRTVRRLRRARSGLRRQQRNVRRVCAVPRGPRR